MNNWFKKYGLSFILALCFYSIANCQERAKPQRTVEELTKIAKKYGMENMISTLKNTELMYIDNNSVEQYFQKAAKVQKGSSEQAALMQETVKVRTHKGFFDLMEKYPLAKENFLKAHNWNEEAYKKHIQSFAKYKWRIYRDKFGGLSFYRADTKVAKGELTQGVRIDNLPKE